MCLRQANTHTILPRISNVPSKPLVTITEQYLTTLSTHKRQILQPPAGLEPAIPASEWSQTDALDRAAKGIGLFYCNLRIFLPSDKHHQVVTAAYINMDPELYVYVLW